MNKDEKKLLLAAAALLLRIGPPPTALTESDKEGLAQLVGGNDWRTIADNMIALIKKVAAEGGA
jgi:hypothetical protein